MKRCAFTILVVDDDRNDRGLIEMAFSELGLTGSIHLVSGVLQALAYLKGEGEYADRFKYPFPNFITTDLNMPGADGFALLEQIKANPAWATIPTVVLSSSSDPGDIRMAYVLGASGYHIKPPTFNELHSQLKVLCDYWMTCQVPAIDPSGEQFPTELEVKLRKRFPRFSSSNENPGPKGPARPVSQRAA